MIWVPPKEIPNGSAGLWRGPCLDAVEVIKVVAPVWPQEHWPVAVALPFAEVGLSTPVRVGNVRSRPVLAWAGSIGDLDLVSPKFGPSYGLWQVRHVLSMPQPPVDPDGNAKAAHARWLIQGWSAWSTFKKGAHRPFLPAAHRAIADFLETQGAPK